MSNIFENKGAMAATIVVAASDSLNQGAANYVCDGVADDVEIQAAIDAISASGVRGTIHLIGHVFNCAAPLVFRSNVDIEGDNAYIDVNDTGADWWAFYFLNVTDAHIKNITFHTGAVQAEQECLVCRGTTGDRVLFENCRFLADKNMGCYFIETEHSWFVNCEARGGTSAGQGGWFLIGSSHSTLIDCRGYGGTGAVYNQHGLTVTEQAYPLIIGGYYEGGVNGTSDAFGMWLYNTAAGDINPDPSSKNVPVVIGVKCRGGNSGDGLRVSGYGRPIITNIQSMKGNAAANYGVDTEDSAAPNFEGGEVYGGVVVSGGSTPIYNGTIIHNDPTSAGRYAIDIGGQGSEPLFNAVTATPVRFPARWGYDDANNGRFQPFAGHPYQLVHVHIDVLVANPGVTLDLGTSIGGSEIAAGINIGAVANVYFDFNKVELAAAGWLYATPSAPIADNDIRVEYTVITNYGTCYAMRLTSGGFARVVNSLLQSNGASDAVYVMNLALTVLNWSIEGSILETFDPVNQYALNAAAAITGAPVKRCTLISRINNITSFCVESYRQHADIFMDVLAVSANHVVNAQTLAADPTVCAIAAQPDVPRTLSYSITHPTLTAFTLTFVGVNAKGRTVTEVFTQATGWTGETLNAFATVTSITMSAMTGNTVADLIDVGITDVLGLSNDILSTADVYKIKKNNANAVVAGAQVNATYDTYDMAVIGLVVGDDFTIWFRSPLNIVS